MFTLNVPYCPIRTLLTPLTCYAIFTISLTIDVCLAPLPPFVVVRASGARSTYLIKILFTTFHSLHSIVRLCFAYHSKSLVKLHCEEVNLFATSCRCLQLGACLQLICLACLESLYTKIRAQHYKSKENLTRSLLQKLFNLHCH